jgi:hypothetical protein
VLLSLRWQNWRSPMGIFVRLGRDRPCGLAVRIVPLRMTSHDSPATRIVGQRRYSLCGPGYS